MVASTKLHSCQANVLPCEGVSAFVCLLVLDGALSVALAVELLCCTVFMGELTLAWQPPRSCYMILC